MLENYLPLVTYLRTSQLSKDRMLRTSAVTLFIALFFLLTSLTAVPSRASSPAAHIAQATDRQHTSIRRIKDGSLGLQLKLMPDGSFAPEYSPTVKPSVRANRSFSSDTRIIKAGDEYLKGLSLEQAQQMLNGTIGESVPVTTFSVTSGELAIRSMPVYPPTELSESSGAYNSLISASDLLRENNHAATLVGIARNLALTKSNWSAGAFYRYIIEPPKFATPKLYGPDPSYGLADSLNFFAHNAMFREFDVAAKQALLLAKQTNYMRPVRFAALTLCTKPIETFGDLHTAQLLYAALDSYESTMPVKDRILFLSAYSHFFEKLHGAGTNKTNTILERLIRLTSKSSGDDPGQSRESAKLLQRAEAFAAAKDINFDDSRWDFVDRSEILKCQKSIFESLQRAEIFEQNTDTSHQIETLLDARKHMVETLSTQQNILLEQCNHPCLSDIDVALAKAYSSSNETKKALESAQRSIDEITLALGSGTSCLKIPLELLKGFASKAGNAQELNSINTHLSLISASEGSDDSLTSASDVDKVLLAKSAFKEISSKNGRRFKLEKFVSDLLSKDQRNLDSGINSLINLIKLKNENRARKQYIEDMHKLDPIFELESYKNSLAHVQQLAEIAIAEKALEEEGDTHQKLDETLIAIQRAAHPELGRRRPISIDRINNYSFLSKLYLVNGEPEKAECVLDFIGSQSSKTFQGRAPATLRMLLLRILKKNEEADQMAGQFTSAGVALTQEEVELVPLIANQLYSDHQADKALALLRDLSSSGSRSPESIFKYHIAEIEYRSKNFTRALAVLDNHYPAGSNSIDSRFLRAYTLESVGKRDDAILQFLSLSQVGDQVVRTSAVEALVSRLSSKEQYSRDTVKALLTQSTSRHLQDKDLIIRYLKCLLARAEAFGIAESETANTRNNLTSSLKDVDRLDESAKTAKNITNILVNNGSAYAPRALMDLAHYYIQAKRFDEGAETTIRALKQPTSGDFVWNNYHLGNLMTEISFKELLAAKRFEQLETIIHMVKEAHLQKDKKAKLYTENYLLVELYLNQSNIEKCREAIKEFIKSIDVSDNFICQSCHGYGDTRTGLGNALVGQLLEHQQLELASTLSNAIWSYEQKWIGPRNFQLAQTLVMQGRIAFLHGNKLQSESDLQRALEIAKWNFGAESRETSTYRTALASFYRDIKRDGKADEVSAIHMDNSKNFDRESIYGGKGGFFRTFPERFPSTALEPLLEQRKYYELQSGYGSNEALKALDDLSDFYVQQTELAAAVKIQLEKLNTLQDIEGSCIDEKAPCLVTLADLYDQLKDASKSTALVGEASCWEPNIHSEPGAQAAMRLAELLTTKSPSKALIFAQSTKSWLVKSGTTPASPATKREQLFARCSEFMNKAGNTEDVEALRRGLEEFKKNEQRMVHF
jgi:predicted negative regulator of RcsB-dependent stress response